jgi:hypothetical protein
MLGKQHDTTSSTSRQEGLLPPRFTSGDPVTGATKKRLRCENKLQQTLAQINAPPQSLWTQHDGSATMPRNRVQPDPTTYRNEMCPSGLALEHPAAPLLQHYATMGCPTMTGKDWTRTQIYEAVRRGPHISALTPEEIAHFKEEAALKEKNGQARLLRWIDIRDNPPKQLKILPISAIPHKSKPFRSILDLSFPLRLCDGTTLSSVNDSTQKTAPQGSIDQMGHTLSRIIHAFASTDPSAKILMAKFDIKDGFWRLDCQDGEEYNFAYLLPHTPITPEKDWLIVVPTSLQMGWIESPGFFCAATETSRDIIDVYANTPLGALPEQKLESYALQSLHNLDLPNTSTKLFQYMTEVYMDDFVSLLVGYLTEHVKHIAHATMMGIYDMFPPDPIPDNNPISLKKLLKGDGNYSTSKSILGFEFDGIKKTLWLEDDKRLAILAILKNWLQTAARSRHGIPFKEFESVIAKVRHAFTVLPEGRGLLSPCNTILRLKPRTVFLQTNSNLREAIYSIQTLLQESTNKPTWCGELVRGHPDYVGICNASSHGVGGVIIGEKLPCIPTVFRMEWPEIIRTNLVTQNNPTGLINNSDLEMGGILLLWLVLEKIIPSLREKNVAIYCDNSPSVGWVTRLASKSSVIAARLIHALSLRMKQTHACPITTLHIPGKENAISNIPSRSFGSVPAWHCTSHKIVLTLFNSTFPLPQQNSWTVFQPTSKICTRLTSLMLTKHSTLDEWRRLPNVGQHIGCTGAATANLWEWTLTFRKPPSNTKYDASQALRCKSDGETTVNIALSTLKQSVALSCPLAR